MAIVTGPYGKSRNIVPGMYAWGEGSNGQLGTGDVESVSSPKIIEFFSGVEVH